MTNKAAFQARFAHYERKPGLKVMRLHFEVPLEKGMETISILGEPTPDNDVWVGIALLGAVSEAQKSAENDANPTNSAPPEKWHELKPSQQAGIRCSEQKFLRFLEEEFSNATVSFERDAARVVRFLCGGLKSRSELNDNTEAASKWKALEGKFQAWMAAG